MARTRFLAKISASGCDIVMTPSIQHTLPRSESRDCVKNAGGPLQLAMTILPQPDETTCGPTCLHAIYAYWGDKEPLADVIHRARWLDEGGTYAVFLGCDALR